MQKLVLAVVCAALIASTASAAHVHKHPVAVQDEYIVTLRTKSPSTIPGIAESLAASYKGQVREVFPYVGGFNLSIPAARAEELAADPRVEFVEQNAILELPLADYLSANQSPTALNGSYLWYLDRIDQRYFSFDIYVGDHGDMNYHYCSTGQGVVVYILDLGVWAAHPEFANVTVQGRNFTNAAADPLNPGVGCLNGPNLWHGTAVASVVAGVNTGVAKGVKVFAAMVGDCDPVTIAHVANALNWINNPNSNSDYNKPGVINWSGWQPAGKTTSSVTIESIVNAVSSHFVVVTSADNFSSNACSKAPNDLGFRGDGYTETTYPYTHYAPSVITVGGTMLNYGVDYRWTEPSVQQGQDGSGSNSGRCVSLWAPAREIYAARHQYFGSNYGTASGTSFASPIVAGLAARYLQTNPSATPAQVYSFLDSQSTKLDASGQPLVKNTTTSDGYNTNGTVGMAYWYETSCP